MATVLYAEDGSLGNSGTDKVGIGTSSPPQKLTVDGITRIRESGNTRYRTDCQVDSGEVHINAYDDTGTAYIPINFDASKYIFGDGIGGNVGVGTNNPSVQLDLESSAASDGIDINNTATDGDPQLRFQLSGTTIVTLGVDDSDSDKFKIGTTSVTTDTRLTIDVSGTVSIGTTTPSAKKFEIKDATASSSVPVARIIANDETPFALVVGNEAQVQSSVDGIRMKVNTNAQGEIDVYSTIATAGPRDLLLQKNGGNIGIGITSSPVAKLDIKNTSNDRTLFIDHDDTGTAASLEIDRDGNNASTITGLKVNVANTGAGSAYAALFETGAVSIGTSTPLAKKFEVKDVAASSSVPVARIIANDATPFALVVGNEARLQSNVDGIRMKINSSDKGEIDVYSTVSTAGPRDLLLQPSGGNVGIGTSSPSKLLHMRGAGAELRIEDTSDSPKLSFYDSTPTERGNIHIGNSGTGEDEDAMYYNAAADEYHYFTVNGTDVMVVGGANGRVGIATTTPGEKLDVNGTIIATGYKSSDGTAGATDNVAVAKVGGGTRTLHYKNGLFTGYTDS